MARTQSERIIFGLKIRQLRQERGWNFEELSKHTGISISYLNEIEKGKKYPQPENQIRLAAAFGVDTAFLSSPELTKQFAPIGDLLKSNFLNEIPLDLFGIEIQQVIEIIARAPDRVNAFISALLEIARNYSLRDEHFFFAALRAYQELRVNYFDEIETVADDFVEQHQLPDKGGVPGDKLAEILTNHYGYKIDYQSLSKHPELQSVRSVYNPFKKRLLLNPQLSERQRAFQLAKECGFNALQLKERPLSSNLTRIDSFEAVLNNYLAAYFAVAILINHKEFKLDIEQFFAQPEWDGRFLLTLMTKYQASPEVLFQRFNILTHDFKLDKVFFIRIIHDIEANSFEIDKELHLNRRHQPHATGLHEHYCRRWLSINLLNKIKDGKADDGEALSGVQRARFIDSGEEYLVIALAKHGYPTVGRSVSVMLGVLLDEHAQNSIAFWNDPKIPQRDINVTCQRCSLLHCAERAAPSTVLQKRDERKRIQDLIQKLTDK